MERFLERKKATDLHRLVYSLNVEDIQTVAEERLQRPLTESEIQTVEQHIPDYINWFDAIADAIHFDLKPTEI